MKVFANHKAMRTFTKLYDGLSEDEKEIFGSRIRTLADKKITADESDEFYITVRDVNNMYKDFKR